LLENPGRARQLLDEREALAREEAWAAENRARLAREAEWYGAPEPAPADRRPRVVAVKSFPHRGVVVELGSIWLRDHEIVQSAPEAFAPVVED
jgi:hypothetical protein